MTVAQVFEVHDELMLEYLVINELIVLVQRGQTLDALLLTMLRIVEEGPSQCAKLDGTRMKRKISAQNRRKLGHECLDFQLIETFVAWKGSHETLEPIFVHLTQLKLCEQRCTLTKAQHEIEIASIAILFYVFDLREVTHVDLIDSPAAVGRGWNRDFVKESARRFLNFVVLFDDEAVQRPILSTDSAWCHEDSQITRKTV